MSEQKEFSIKNYLGFLAEKKLMGSVCQKCGYVDCPPRRCCANCGSTALMWKEFSGKATLYAWSRIFIPATKFKKKGFNNKNPYVFGIMQLEEGPRLTARLVLENPKDPQYVVLGKHYVAQFLPATEADPRPELAFIPA